MPDAPTGAGLEAIELAESAGLFLDDWQREFLLDALGERKDGKWAALEVGLVVPRQNGKGSILEARELAGLFLFGEELILHSAHEFKTATEAFTRLLNLVKQTADLERLVHKVRMSHGEEAIELKTGQRIRFVARSTGAGRGFTGETIVLDEAYNLPGAAMSALVPTMAARSIDGNPQLWYTSSAPLARPESDTLRRLCRRGRKGEPRLCFSEFCAEPDAANDDKGAWAEANPGLGIRISEEYIEAMELAALEPEDFARERLGIWREDEMERLITAADWQATNHPELKLANPVVLAVDVTPDRAWSAISAASDLDVEVVDQRKGTGWVHQHLVDVYQRQGAAGVVINPGSQAESFVEGFEAAGLNVILADLSDYRAACGQFYEAVVEHRLRHLPQPELEAAVAGAVAKNSSDGWVWNRRGGANIAPLVACTLALWGTSQIEPPKTAGMVLLSEV